MELEDYCTRFKTAEVTRDEAGVLTVRLHSRGGSLLWGGLPHRELPELFTAIASDRDNRVVVLTGSGDAFITLPDGGNPLAEGRPTPRCGTSSSGRATAWSTRCSTSRYQ